MSRHTLHFKNAVCTSFYQNHRLRRAVINIIQGAVDIERHQSSSWSEGRTTSHSRMFNIHRGCSAMLRVSFSRRHSSAI